MTGDQFFGILLFAFVIWIATMSILWQAMDRVVKAIKETRSI